MARNSTASIIELLEAESSHGSRLFIGPMPIATAKKNAPQIDNNKNYWWSRIRKRARRVDDEESGGEWDEGGIPDTEAFRFFMHRGGRKEAWESNTLRKSVKQDMLRRLQQSGWSNLFRPKNVQPQPQKWIGTTFIIGKDFLGLPLDLSLPSPNDISPITPQTLSEPVEPNGFPEVAENSESTSEEIRNSKTLSISSLNNTTPQANNSTTALVQPVHASPDRPATPGPSTPRPSSGFRSAFNLNSPQTSPLQSTFRRSAIKDTEAGRSIRFSRSSLPVSPRKVLNRSPASVPHTSAEASSPQTRGQRECGDVIRRERLLVRKGYTKSGHVRRNFGAIEASRLRDLQSQEWKEFLVVWRKQRLELYEDYSIPVKEKLLGHKHLAFVIPLDSSKSSISLYSFVDLSFCLSCTELTTMKDKHPVYGSITDRLPFFRSTGTHIFVFKTKTRTSGIDWLWDIWNELNYDLPRTVEIHCPLVQAFVKLRLPEVITSKQSEALFSIENVIERCLKGLEILPSWGFLTGQRLETGATFQLCWRNEAVLDWIQWEKDLTGKPRDASVLYGLCLKRPHEITRLELRIGEHRPAYVVKDSGKIFEPPPVEGYVYRIKSRTHTRILLYLSVHLGCLFFISPAKAHPPIPPLPTTSHGHVDNTGKDTSAEGEKRRGPLQVFFSNAFMDLRNISVVRRTFTSVPIDFRDNLDVGGDEGFKKYPDIPKVTLRLRRSFELLTENGQTIQFETHSCAIVQQWVDQLNKLVDFWKQRHRADATQEMKIVDAISHRKDIYRPAGSSQLSAVKPNDLSEDISLFWNRCDVYDCHSITRTGRLFMKKGLNGQYRLAQFILIAGHVVQFDVLPSLQNPRSSTISLMDAYVCSGHFATQSLSVDEFSIVESPLSRRFQDGLEAQDHELELVFIVWFRPHVPKKNILDGHGAKVPAINAKHKLIVFKARSKLERDFWCWAFNDEIEKTARRHVSRELQLQEGGLMSI